MNHIPDVLMALQQAGEHLVSAGLHLLNAMNELREAQVGVVTAVEAAIQADLDRDDLRETIDRHEREILDLSERLRRAEGGT